MKFSISTVLAILVGFLVLIGYFIAPLAPMRNVLLQWAVILAAFALIVGVANMLHVHLSKVRRRQAGAGYSIILILSLIVTIIVGLIAGPAGNWTMWLFNNIQVPVEASLMALLALVLVFATARMIRRRPTTFSVVFVATTFLVLLGTAPLFYLNEVPLFANIRDVLVQVGGVAGARGILLGVALGTIVTGLRILIGSDRPYGG